MSFRRLRTAERDGVCSYFFTCAVISNAQPPENWPGPLPAAGCHGNAPIQLHWATA